MKTRYVLSLMLFTLTPVFSLAYGVEDLIRDAKKPSVQTVSDLIRQLPEQMLGQFTLIHSSLSLQESSYENPRVVLFNDDGSLILTFNGQPDQRGYAGVEVASFDGVRERIEFREIIFREDARRVTGSSSGEISLDDVGFRNQAVQISKANPMKCLGCHSAEPNRILSQGSEKLMRYIWHPYETWPGAYGSEDDYAYGASDKVKTEIENLKKFKLHVKENDRYKHLVIFPGDRSPYCNTKNEDGGVAPLSDACRPNLKLTSMIGLYQIRQLAQVLRSRAGEFALTSYLKQRYSCEASSESPKSQQTAFELDSTTFYSVPEIFAAIRPISDPAAFRPNVERFPDAKTSWVLGNESWLGGGNDLASHFSGAVIRELAKTNSAFRDLRDNLSTLIYGSSKRVVEVSEGLVKLGYKSEHVRLLMEHALNFEREEWTADPSFDPAAAICKALKN